MVEIDLTIPTKVYYVTTQLLRKGIPCMGPVVNINAHSADDAEQRVGAVGYTPNKLFPPTTY